MSLFIFWQRDAWAQGMSWDFKMIPLNNPEQVTVYNKLDLNHYEIKQIKLYVYANTLESEAKPKKIISPVELKFLITGHNKDYTDSCSIGARPPIVGIASNVGIGTSTEVRISAKGFFPKTISFTTMSAGIGKNKSQFWNIPDSIEIGLDSIFSEGSDINMQNGLMIGSIESFRILSNGYLEKNERYAKAGNRDNYHAWLESNKKWREEFYAKIRNRFRRESDVSTIQQDSGADEGRLEQVIDSTVKNIHEEDMAAPSAFQPQSTIFPEEGLEAGIEKRKLKFRKFQLDTLQLYQTRKVQEGLRELKKSSGEMTKISDTLRYYSKLYRSNKDFIVLGNKVLTYFDESDSNLRFVKNLKTEILEKEVENHYIKKEIKELQLRLKLQQEEIKMSQFMTRGSIILGLIMAIAFIVIYSQWRRTEKMHLSLKEKTRELRESIDYARLIQTAILPESKQLEKLSEHFILYKPKDVVSGDFYWFAEIEDRKFIGICDCTGHGVPGSLMSMICSELLNEAVMQFQEPGKILEYVNRKLKLSLKQQEGKSSTQDGMEGVIMCFGPNQGITYASAHRPVWIKKKSESEITILPAQKNAVGGPTPDDVVFETRQLELHSGDTLYLFTDGYADQFSGQGKKLMTKKMKEYLVSIAALPIEEQGIKLEEFFESWKGNAEQTDDVLVMGMQWSHPFTG